MKSLFLLLLPLIITSCMDTNETPPTDNRQAIITTLENETKYFCERKLAQWQAQWSHAPYVSKMYAGAVDFEYVNGWPAINQFTEDHIQNHPEPIAIPDLAFDYDIHLFAETALVFYAKEVDGKTVRETRFMVKEDNKWKIARMETIY